MALDTRDINAITKHVAGVLAPRFGRIERRAAHVRRATDKLETRLVSEVAASNRKFYTVFTDLVVLRDELAALKLQDRDQRLGRDHKMDR